MVAAVYDTKTPTFRFRADAAHGAQLFRDSSITMGADLTGYYPSEKQADGNYTIRNVDLFRATQRVNPGTGKMDVFDQKFLEGACQRFGELKQQHGGRYLPPVHIEHHSNGRIPTFAGHLDNLKVRPGSDGVATLFGDMVDIPPQVFAEIMAKRVPYRSVEINNPNVAEISSLALLTSTVPYHKLPLLRVTPPSDAANFSECPAYFAEYIGSSAVAVQQRFASPYAAMSVPTKARQRFAGQYYADGDEEQEEMPPQGGGEEAAPMQDISDEELAMLLGEGNGDMGGGDMDPYGDEMEAAELGYEPGSEQMGQVLDALGAMNQTLQQVLQVSQANAATGTPQPPAAVPMQETPVGGKSNGSGSTAVHFNDNGDGTATISKAYLEGLEHRLQKFEETQGKLVNFAENLIADAEDQKFWDRAAGIRDQLVNDAVGRGIELDEKAVQRFSDSVTDRIIAAESRGMDLSNGNLEKVMSAHFSDYVAGIGGSVQTPPKADSGNTQPNTAKPVKSIARDEVQKFAESSTLPKVKKMLADDPDKLARDYAEAVSVEGIKFSEWPGGKTAFVDYVFNQNESYQGV